MASVQSPPGWYADPADRTRLRWWSGSEWGESASTAASPWLPSAVPPRPRKPVWPWIVGGAALLWVILLIGGVLAAIFVPRIVSAFKGPVDAANVYMRDVRDERLSTAYKQLCARRFGTVTFDDYVTRIHTQQDQTGRILKFNAHGTHRVRGQRDDALVDIDLTTTRGTFPIEADMVKENGHWRWCGYRPAAD